MIEGKSTTASLDAEHELKVEDPSRVSFADEGNSSGRRMTLNMGPQLSLIHI